ncbi:MAG TPA: ATP-binding protein [Stellaceae bacterium]|nr:ATP-binding protein [Stellaceae bacterium]
MSIAADQSPGRKSEWLPSQPRPLTLLILCGIVLGAVLLIVTGLVAGYLRQQTLESTKAGLSRLDAVLAEAGNRSLLGTEAVLREIAGHAPLGEAASSGNLERVLGTAPQVSGLALTGSDGTLINRAGDWPAGEDSVAKRDYFVALQSDNALESAIGAPITLWPGALGPGRVSVVPVARKLHTAGGGFAGLAVAMLPVSGFASLYRAIPLGEGGLVSLLRRDGTVLAQFPQQDNADRISNRAVRRALANGDQGVFEGDHDKNGEWYIDAVRPLADYPVSVIVSGSGTHALTAWARQAAMFAAFAVCGVMTIAVMVVLIGRQIHTHNALAAIRAEKIEADNARLVAEAELLKKERLSVLGQFTATVANELRNPLSAIRNTLFTMREIATSSGLALDRPIARIQRSIARCDRIIADLLEYIRTPELTRVSVNFDEWLREILVEHGLPPAVTLVEEYAAPDAVVRIDADRIRHVVINLVDNAAQALGEMPPGRGPLRIAVRTALADGGLELGVSDTGPGIPPENMARIFEPLFSTKSFGAGLGLPTVKQIVTQHGGTIDVHSELKAGTTITIRLPVEQALRAAA